jgi:hypothetical protein
MVITIDSQTGSGDAIDLEGQPVTVTVPDGSIREVTLALESPGRYEARLDAPTPGAYRLALTEPDLGLAGAVPVSPEWLPAENGAGLLESIAERTGGAVRSLDQAPDASVFDAARPEGRAPGVVRPLWYVPLALALILFVSEIAIRQARLWGGDQPTA